MVAISHLLSLYWHMKSLSIVTMTATMEKLAADNLATNISVNMRKDEVGIHHLQKKCN